MLLMIDNYDSFTYNLVQYFGELKQDVVVHRNDEITLEGVERLNPARIVVSPGPCTPNEAGISVPAIQHFAGKVPILGVCLGHQSIGQAFGGKIIHAKQVMHGKMSAVHHRSQSVFRNLPNPLQAAGWCLEAMHRAWAAPCPLLLPLKPTALVIEEIAWLAARFFLDELAPSAKGRVA